MVVYVQGHGEEERYVIRLSIGTSYCKHDHYAHGQQELNCFLGKCVGAMHCSILLCDQLTSMYLKLKYMEMVPLLSGIWSLLTARPGGLLQA